MKSDIVTSVGLRLAELRAERGFTLQEVADRSDLSKSRVWEIEQGRAKNPTLETVMRLADTLGVSLDYLTGVASGEVNLHPEALRIACEIDAVLRKAERPESN